MPESPWFKFYAAEWLADWRLRQQRPAVRAAILDLRAIQWLEGEVPRNPHDVCGITGCDLVDAQDALAFFPVEGGKARCPKIEGLRRDMIATSKRNRRNAKGGKGKRATRSADGGAGISSDLLSSENGTPEEDVPF